MKDEPREMFPIRFMDWGGAGAEQVYTDKMNASGVIDFRPSVLPADAEDPTPIQPEATPDDPKDSSAIEPASGSGADSSSPETPSGPSPSPSESPEAPADVVKVPPSQGLLLPPPIPGTGKA